MIVGLLCAAANVVIAAPPVPAAPTQQVPGVYRQAIGQFLVTALFDGVVPLARDELLGIDAKRLDALLDHHYVPETPKGLQTAVNAFLVQDGSHLTLVDTGTAQCFGPGLGQVLANLRAAGYAPEQVDTILLTHGHPDHLCGVLDDQGHIAYPNATVWLSATDAAYWLDPANEAKAPKDAKALYSMARKAVAPYEAAHKLRRFTDADADTKSLPRGFSEVATAGHTPGHTSWLLDGGNGERMLIWGDLVHYHAVQFAQPTASFEADVDRAAAIAMRRGILTRAADTNLWVAGAHLPFPGIGHVRREGDAFAWVPAEFSPLPAPAKATK